MLHAFSEGIWTADGPCLDVAGFGYPTRMIVIRLAGGALFVWSPVALDAGLRAAINRLGPVGHVVAPNTLHYKFVGEWAAAYPAARLHALPALRARRTDVAWTDDLGDTPAVAWADEIDQVVAGGNWIATEVVFFHRPSRTAIFTDLLQQFEPGWFTGWRAVVARLDLLTAAELTVPRKFRVAFVGRRRARAAVRRVLAWPTERVLAAHAAPVMAEGRAVTARALGWLLRSSVKRPIPA